MRHEDGPGRREQRAGHAVVTRWPHTQRRRRCVVADQPITVCPWPGVIFPHNVLIGTSYGALARGLTRARARRLRRRRRGPRAAGDLAELDRLHHGHRDRSGTTETETEPEETETSPTAPAAPAAPRPARSRRAAPATRSRPAPRRWSPGAAASSRRG